MKIKNVFDESNLDMTPMIDMVFNMIIFFMLTIDLAQSELANITLPRASECQEDKNPPEGRKVVNIDSEGTIIVKRKPFPLEKLRSDLYVWSRLQPRDDAGFCEKPILIRTDRGTNMKHLQKIMMICGEEQLKIWKIELACSEDVRGFTNFEIPGRVDRNEKPAGD